MLRVADTYEQGSKLRLLPVLAGRQERYACRQSDGLWCGKLRVAVPCKQVKSAVVSRSRDQIRMVSSGEPSTR